MRHARLVIILLGILATTLCFLFPLSEMSDNWWAPMPMWLFDALHFVPNENGYVIIAWLSIAVEFCFVVSLFSVLYRATFFRGKEAVRYALSALFLPLLCFAFTHFARLNYAIAGLDDYLAVLGITYYMQIAFLIGTVLLRKRRRARAIRVGRLDETADPEAGRDSEGKRTWKEQVTWAVRGVGTLILCAALLIFPFSVRGEISETLKYAPLWSPPPGAHFGDYVDVGWMFLQYGVQVLIASVCFFVLLFATASGSPKNAHAVA